MKKMRRADRLMQIIQMFRRHSAARRGPLTARAIARELEVTTRTVYRDIAALMANGVPLRGEAGVGYVMGEGYDLPPMMFSVDELEALMLGARMVSVQGDDELARSARDAIAKIAAVVPGQLRASLLDAPLYAPDFGVSEIDVVDAADIRAALRQNTKLVIHYEDAEGDETMRTIWPVALAYHKGTRLLAAWCELRGDFRHFRVDRMHRLVCTTDKVPERREALFHRWWKQEGGGKEDYQLDRG